LRYFYEIAPEQHIIAAGSLLEYLKARKEELLIEALIEHSPSIAINEAIHQKALRILGEFMAVGGMPEAVSAWINSGDLKNCSKINRTIIDTYRQDFNKYVEKYQVKYVELLFNILPIEVKSGSPGHLKSLQLFLQTHNGSPQGIRFSSQNFAIDNHIHSYPLYAVFKLIPPDPDVLRSFIS
jgi:hypothetical protein